MKRAVAALLLIMLLLTFSFSLVSCETKPRTKRFYYFDTESKVSLYGRDVRMADEVYARCEEVLSRYGKLFDIYFEYSGVNNLKTVNKNAGIAPVAVDEDIIGLLLRSKELYTLTGGETNVMMGSVLKIWHKYRTDALGNPDRPEYQKIPEEQELLAASAHTSIDSLIIDEEAGTVYISDPEASIDVGAVAKGYAAEKLAEELAGMGISECVLNIGGAIRTLGLKDGKNMWSTAIRNPDKNATDFALRLEIGVCSLVTSGSYERWYTVDGVDYHHVIDKDTLYPARYFVSVSVIAPDNSLGDALSTALFCMSYEDGLELVSQLEGVEVFWIYADGTQRMTDGFAERVLK